MENQIYHFSYLRSTNSLVNIIMIMSKIHNETFSMQVFNLQLRNQHYIDALGTTGLINGPVASFKKLLWTGECLEEFTGYGFDSPSWL